MLLFRPSINLAYLSKDALTPRQANTQISTTDVFIYYR